MTIANVVQSNDAVNGMGVVLLANWAAWAEQLGSEGHWHCNSRCGDSHLPAVVPIGALPPPPHLARVPRLALPPPVLVRKALPDVRGVAGG